MCKLCDEMFLTEEEVKEHLAKKHRDEFSTWLEGNALYEFEEWAKKQYWEEFVTEKLLDTDFDDWAEENYTEVKV